MISEVTKRITIHLVRELSSSASCVELSDSGSDITPSSQAQRCHETGERRILTLTTDIWMHETRRNSCRGHMCSFPHLRQSEPDIHYKHTSRPNAQMGGEARFGCRPRYRAPCLSCFGQRRGKDEAPSSVMGVGTCISSLAGANGGAD